MTREDIIYLLLLLISIPLGHLVKSLRSSSGRQFITFVAGLTVVLLTAGLEGIWHSALTILGNYFIVRIFGKRSCHIASFLFVFGYLFFFRTCTWYGFPKPPSHCNAIQLLVTLRMVGLAFEIHQRKEISDDDKAFSVHASKITYLVNQPSLYDYYSYGYCYCGLMTGPYYSFLTYQDMLIQDTSNISTVIPALKALKHLPLFAVPYLVLQHYFPLKHIETEDFLDHRWGVLYRLLYISPCFTWFRLRFYLGWMLAKSMCITMALGAYPFESEPKPGVGPTKAIEPKDKQEAEEIKNDLSDTHSFDAIHNIDIFDVEFCCCVKAVMKAWNKTVQWWLYKYVHQQVPFKSFRMTIVLLVSAFWHGVHPGYYVTFMSVPLLAIADGGMRKAVLPYLSAKQKYWYDWLNWLLLYRAMEYLCIGFIMLKLDIIWEVYKKLYFCGHIIMLILALIPFFIPKKKASPQPEGKSPEKVH